MTLAPPREKRGIVVGNNKGAFPLSDDWEAAFWGSSELARRAWYVRNTGPRVRPVNREPLTGEIVIASQADADALVGRVIINGHVDITANNVDVRDFWVFADDAEWVVKIPQGGYGLNVHHLYIDGQRKAGNNKGLGYATSAGIHAHHIHIQGMADGFRYSAGGLYEYMFVHDVMNWSKVSSVAYNPDTHPHIDGSQFVGSGSGGGFTLRRSYIEALPGSGVVGCVTMNATLGVISDVLIEENYFNGGGRTIQNVDPGYGNGAASGVIRNNLFAPGYGSGGGLWNLLDPETFVRVGNRWARSKRPVPLTNGAMVKPDANAW